MLHVESLPGMVRRKRNPILRGMPGRIDRPHRDRIRRESELAHLVALHQDRAGMVGPDVKQHPIRTILLERMAIHAMILIVMKPPVVLVESRHVEILYTPLVEAQLAVIRIARLNQAISDIRVNLLGRYEKRASRITHPTRRRTGVDRQLETIPPMRVQQAMPGPHLELNRLGGLG